MEVGGPKNSEQSFGAAEPGQKPRPCVCVALFSAVGEQKQFDTPLAVLFCSVGPV